MTVDHIGIGLAKLEFTNEDADGPTLHFRVADNVTPGWTMPIGRSHRVTDSRTAGDALELDITVFPYALVEGHGPLKLTIRASLEAESVTGAGYVCDLELQGDDPDFPMQDLGFPGPLSIQHQSTTADWTYLLPVGQGVLIDAEGTALDALGDADWHQYQIPRSLVEFHDYKVTLPMVAALHERGAAVMATTFQGHDHAVRPSYPTEGGSEDAGFQLVQMASLGTWRYDRSWRIVTIGTGGVNALAMIVREALDSAASGWLGLDEKIARLPEANRLALGGTHLWCHLDTYTTEMVNNLVGSGIKSLMVMGRPSDETAGAAVKEAGFGFGPYFQTYDVFPPGSVEVLEWRNTYPPEGACHGFPEQLRRNRNGYLDYAWIHTPSPHARLDWEYSDALGSDGSVIRRTTALHDRVPVQSYRRCQIFHREVIAQYGLPMLDRLGANAVFYDICCTLFGLECASLDHPCDRRQDVELRIEALKLVGGDGRIVTSEDGKWWALNSVHAFEGGLTYDGMEAIANTTVTDYEFDPGTWNTEFSLERRIPFFSMVAGHTVAMTFWWGRGQDRHPETRRAKDAFAALAGGNPIFMVDPEHPLTPGTERWDEFVATATAFDMLREHTLGVPIESYEAHGPHTASTTYENGVVVTANTGPAPEGGLDPGEYRVYTSDGALIAGNGPYGGSGH